MAYEDHDAPLPLGYDDKDDEVGDYQPPDYSRAGTTMGGEDVLECQNCGALLRDSNAFLHSHWHELNGRRI